MAIRHNTSSLRECGRLDSYRGFQKKNYDKIMIKDLYIYAYIALIVWQCIKIIKQSIQYINLIDLYGEQNYNSTKLLIEVFILSDS